MASLRKVHFVGIGGIGMSALAQYYLAKGWQVSGSDLIQSEMTDILEKAGVEISIGHKALNLLERIDRVIYSAAVKGLLPSPLFDDFEKFSSTSRTKKDEELSEHTSESFFERRVENFSKGQNMGLGSRSMDDNPELEQARHFNAEILSYAEALGELTRQYITVAVSGAHGKSTTTALLSLMLIKAGLDPTVIIGTRLREFGGLNFCLGESRYLVIEADEYNKSFLHYYPTIAVITNIDKEHLDTYGNLTGVINGFAQYFKNIANIGALVFDGQDANLLEAVKIWQATRLSDDGPKCLQCVAALRGTKRWPLKIPGEFNQLNAELAWQAASLLGVSRAMARQAISKYLGSWRRLEPLLPRRRTWGLDSQKFFSDYAHHPTEIKATLKALKEFFPKKKLVIVFQPHQLERLNNLFADFASAFDNCQYLFLMPAYQVVGRESPSNLRTAEDLFLAIKNHQQKEKIFKEISYLKSFPAALKLTKQIPNSVVVYMGAGDMDQEVKKYFRSRLF